ncbi:mRNA splicing protein SPP382 KNAG_0B06500 [Huiozyma naganishii CBS 8797]|uniref:G-patch domain-containing protein n=1 Tax=Huiozyma naganishii (strain ATCC MYA-139 / BCRC 22969 / CBS 8797 / KCTC 17520 / NBRC 10181 / NCYC 3082 / Yp74L-3) TaxID=1071383 RepID=J7RHQ7_HUIN7|nr:hypothetical protein KNAG_0B06500 [Kazachstania naganishii CBS 8797]CCK69078.1 hypothetical protein KNAG_0B06500 [Kazachstania naganishii CBS 8797]
MQGKRQRPTQDGEQASASLKRQYGVGATLLARMGYKAGQGLGKDGAGIDSPIEVQARPQGHVGLGQMSGLMGRVRGSQDDGWGSPSETSSESESETGEDLPRGNGRPALPSPVTFTRTGATTLTPRERKSIASRLRALQLADVSEVIDRVSTLERVPMSKKRELLELVDRLQEAQARLGLLKRRMPLLAAEEQSLEDNLSQISSAKTQLDTLGPSSEFEEVTTAIDSIMLIADDEVVDLLVYKLLHNLFLPTGEGTMASLKRTRNLILPLVELLTYRLETVPGRLNKTQSAIFKIVFPQLVPHWEAVAFSDTQQALTVCSLLAEFDHVLKFIGCYEYVYDRYMVPKIVAALESWDPMDPQMQPQFWLREIYGQLPPRDISTVQEIVRAKITAYFSEWYHRDPLPADEVFKLVRDILPNDEYDNISRKHLVKQLVSQVWDKYFNLALDVEETYRDPDAEACSLYAAMRIRSCRILLAQQDYDLLVKAVFNELNKFVFDWINFQRDCKDDVKLWFNWFINELFSKELPSVEELEQVRRSYRVIDSGVPDHDETFDVGDVLSGVVEDEESNGTATNAYTVSNIPLRKVTATFKEVIEDYCEQHGYLLQKTSNQFAHLPYGRNNSAMVPVFQVQRGSRNARIAIKDDILWLEDPHGIFKPLFLYELVL